LYIASSFFKHFLAENTILVVYQVILNNTIYMRYLIIFICSFILTYTQAQNFEGVITWKFTVDIPDIKGENDPAAKALQNQLNDPEFQKQMEHSPALKKMLEEQLSKLQAGSFLSSLIPTGMTMKIKDGNSLTKIDGGLGTEVLSIKDKSYRINRSKKTYTLIPNEENKKDSKTDDIKVTPVNETTKILNYTCKKYLIEDASGVKMIIWATTEIKGVDFKSSYESQELNNAYFSKIEGFPLKIESDNENAKFAMEVTEVSKTAQNAEDFKIPAGFKEKKS
jgi:hypothetical protein